MRPELCWPSFPISLVLNSKCLLLHVNNDEKTWIVETQVQQDFHWFQLTSTLQIRAWGLMHGEEKDILKQIQELSSYCRREFVMSSDHRSAPKTAKKPFFFLKSHLSRWLLSFTEWQKSLRLTKVFHVTKVFPGWQPEKQQPTWYWIDTSWYELTLSWHWWALRRRPADGGATIRWKRLRFRLKVEMGFESHTSLPVTSQYRALLFV